jgi:GNAT superfamily N-acetyltransferase
VDQRLTRALDFDRAVRTRGAQHVRAIRHGVVVLHERLPRLHHLNAVLLDAPLSDGLSSARAIAGLADAQLGHLGHRHVVLDDAAAAERLAPGLLADDWTRDRVVYMAMHRGPGGRPTAHPTRALSEDEVEALQLTMLAEDAPGDAAVATALARQLVAGQSALRAGTRSLCLAAFDGARPVSSATLFLQHASGGLAMIDEVGTLRAHRERGFARAAISAAIDAAIDAGCEEIVVPADADDWPQLLYAKLGFARLGRQVSFTLSVGSGSP